MLNLIISDNSYNESNLMSAQTDIDTETDIDIESIFTSLYKKEFYPDMTTHYYFNKSFSQEECNKIINAFSEKCYIDSTTFNNDSLYRKSKITWIPYNSSTKWIYDRLIYYANLANNETYNFDVTSIYDKIQFACYDGDNSDKYDTHIDIGSNNIYSCRKLSITVQLSIDDTYTGGDVEIRNIKISREQGSLTVFPSFLEHKVNPVISGKRYSLVLWLYGPHFK